MGIDIVLYGVDNKILGVVEISRQLHDALFQENKNWSSYFFLRRLQDYYETNLQYNRLEIDSLLQDFSHIKMFIEKQHYQRLDQIMLLLSDSRIERIHIAGD